MLNSAFDAFTDVRTDYYPAELRAEIDRINDVVYSTVNNGVYRSGFATTQAAYEEAARALFATLDRARSSGCRGSVISSDSRSPKRIGGCSRRWCVSTRSITATSNAICGASSTIRICRIICASFIRCPGVAETVNLDHIKRHYYGSHRNVNPTGIVPIGPVLDFTLPHDRGRFG